MCGTPKSAGHTSSAKHILPFSDHTFMVVLVMVLQHHIYDPTGGHIADPMDNVSIPSILQAILLLSAYNSLLPS